MSNSDSGASELSSNYDTDESRSLGSDSSLVSSDESMHTSDEEFFDNASISSVSTEPDGFEEIIRAIKDLKKTLLTEIKLNRVYIERTF